MKVDGQHFRTIWRDDDGWAVRVIDQTVLPFNFETRRLESMQEAADAISTMVVRGAPLIGATAAYGLALAMRADPSDANLVVACERLMSTRPTAVNLRWALDDVRTRLEALDTGGRQRAAYARADEICDEDAQACHAIGQHGLGVFERRYEQLGRPERLEILTHCNAGWLATVDWGTALAPIYAAADAGLPVHVWVDETRPRNQGASLTAWELGAHGIDHTVIVDNAGGHLMQHGRVHLCIVGSDRTTRTADVCNKIGTYLKALAAHDNDVPFWVALPHTTIDWTLRDGVAEIPIEERDPDEVHRVRGDARSVRVTPPGSPAANYGFDVTPARLVTGLITERGTCEASEEGLQGLYPEAPS